MGTTELRLHGNITFRTLYFSLCAIPALTGVYTYFHYQHSPFLCAVAGALMFWATAKTWRMIHSLRRKRALVELYDHCVVDTRSMKEWVYWEDVKEIIVCNESTFGLKVDDEDYYAKTPSFCMAPHVIRFLGYPRLTVSAVLLNCSPRQLYREILKAAKAYDIPVRRLSAA